MLVVMLHPRNCDEKGVYRAEPICQAPHALESLACPRRTVLGLWLWRKSANRKPRSPRVRQWYLDFTEQFNLAVPWYRLPLPLALVNFIGMRMLLRARNLPRYAEPAGCRSGRGSPGGPAQPARPIR